jgi:hypothetical protein
VRRLAALVAILALAAPGCASNDKELHRQLVAERLEPLKIVTRAEIDAQPPGSPARTVLVLWRAVQFRDGEGAIRHISPQPNPQQRASFEDFIAGPGAQVAGPTKPRLLSTSVHGRRAEVLVDLVSYKKVGDKVRPIVVGRLRAQLARSGSGWVVLWRESFDAIAKALS